MKKSGTDFSSITSIFCSEYLVQQRNLNIKTLQQ